MSVCSECDTDNSNVNVKQNGDSICTKANKITNEDYDKCIIEYIDTDEEDTCMVAMTQQDILKNLENMKNGKVYKNYTHCEIHPSMIFGSMSTNIPFIKS